MPEGPELYKASLLVNEACNDHVFAGKIVKSAVSTKNPSIPTFKNGDYTIRAEARGKEMALILTPYASDEEKKTCSENKSSSLRILFRFGMSGKFMFCSPAEIHKHAHLKFYTKEKPKMVLSFVDVRRFGRWQISDTWSTDRGPDPVFEYSAFRSNVLEHLEDTIFNKPLCEVMHNQRFFNGIGNYLRAEIIFRANVAPFISARSVFGKLKVKQEDCKESKENSSVEDSDILQLCRVVPQEVINLSGAGYDPEGAHSDYSAFREWLQCYYNPAMRNLVDHDGRTIWFKGEAGPLAPKGTKSRTMKTSRKRKSKEEDTKQGPEEITTSPKKVKRNNTQQSKGQKARAVKPGKKRKTRDTNKDTKNKGTPPPGKVTRKDTRYQSNKVTPPPSKVTRKDTQRTKVPPRQSQRIKQPVKK